MDQQEKKPSKRPAPMPMPRLSKRGSVLDKLIAEHCQKYGIDREFFERAYAREFNERSRFLNRNYLMCEIDGIVADGPQELMICFVARCAGLAQVHGYNYKVIRVDDG